MTMTRHALVVALLVAVVLAAAGRVARGQEGELAYGDTLSLPVGKVAVFTNAEFDLTGHIGTLYCELALEGVSPGLVTNLPATYLKRLVPTVRIGGTTGSEGNPSNAPFALSGPMDLRLIVYDLGTLSYDDPLTNTVIRYTLRDASVAGRACQTWAAAANATVKIESSRNLDEWHTTQDGLFGSHDHRFFRTRGCGVSMEAIVGTDN